ncbi:MAG: Galactoside O-acetyltransferase [Syntrophus sp. PtaU1.Bin208]|nr:MAG: Galactoside O-acetyltransferase [Syntrophus sp. PtaU1.Bin208]
MSIVSKGIRLFIDNPVGFAGLVKALLRGTLTVLYCKIAKPRVRIEFPFFMYETFRVNGPGRVFVGSYCWIYPNMFEGVSIVTLDPDAEVRIGRNCSLGGVTIRCRKKIEIGDRILAAQSLIQDCMLAECPGMWADGAIPQEMIPRPIKIGRNVWIGAQSCILGGTTIGDESVISLGTVCHGTMIEEYHLASGNPSLRPVSISRLTRMQDRLR